MTLEGLIIFLLIGAVAGWLAGVVVKGGGFGLVGDIVVGILGAFIAGLLLPRLGLGLNGIAGEIIFAASGLLGSTSYSINRIVPLRRIATGAGQLLLRVRTRCLQSLVATTFSAERAHRDGTANIAMSANIAEDLCHMDSSRGACFRPPSIERQFCQKNS